ncbi:hypothetical protein G195_000922 [Phytophthora kernoviae 00238/432]|uniref:ATP-grasp domain-containing protein n=1 Tax=Phytophthora kernoviae 00238/432 TaxID=1284355 RepID=A0A8J4SUM5_9STRA|nr:hypothetical protein G195_000922 [Phytophthora kernoviae 00238/432]
MSTKKVTIQVTGSGILQDDVIMLGEGVLKALKIPSGRPLQLQFGSFRREVTVIPVPSGRPVDFRALVQKNRTGKWSVTSIVARIAGGSHYVSNLARGGSLSTVKEAVAKTQLSGSAKASAYAGLHTAALDIAKGIEGAIPAHFGELGIDLALDTSGKVWLLEVNSKPSKNDNTPLSESKIRPSVKAMLEYSTYLAGF